MFSLIKSACTYGVNGIIIRVEADSSAGFPSFNIVGLPDAAVKESKERVRSALKNSGFYLPDGHITVNLAPADIKKEGALFDLPMAIGLLLASRQLRIKKDFDLDSLLMVGELSLNGNIQKIDGTLPITFSAAHAGLKGIIVPYDNKREAAFVSGIDVYPAKNIGEVVNFIEGKNEITPEVIDIEQAFEKSGFYDVDYSEIKGQEIAKRAMLIGAAGGHNVLLIGPQGSGKTMLARRLPTILPPLHIDEAMETTRIHSIRGLVNKDIGIVSTRPFRAPHHTISYAGMIGGTANALPGEVSLAHNGVLFLDELPYFQKNVLESLRQPLEDGVVTIARANVTIEYPSDFMLVAAMNPCECGHYGDPVIPCTCSPMQIHRCRNKVSGPLLDRIDIQIEVSRPRSEDIVYSEGKPGLDSASMKNVLLKAREIQTARYKNENIFSNAQLKGKQIEKYCSLNEASKQLLNQAMQRLGLSARAFDKIRKVARTIADIQESTEIEEAHIAEAINYRALDNNSYFFGGK